VSRCITVKYEYAPLTYQNKKNDLYLHVFALPILLSLQSNDKYSENNHPSQCRITVTLHRLSGALLSICALRSTLNVFFFLSLILRSFLRVHPNKTALKSERGQAHMNERRKLSATFTLQRKNSDAFISVQQ